MLRHGPLRINRSSPFKIAKSFSRTKGLLWRHDLFEDSMAAAGLAGVEGGTKLYISNLDYGVSNEDIKQLFSEVGDLKRSTTHYDRNGRSSLGCQFLVHGGKYIGGLDEFELARNMILSSSF